MGHQEDNEIPLNSIPRRFEEELENGQSNDYSFQASNNRRENRKPFNSKKWFRIITVVLGLVIAVALISYFIYVNFLKGVPKSQISIKPTSRGLVPPNPEVNILPSASTLHMFDKAAICTDTDICSKIGRDLFQRGGNAVDVALSGLFCNGLTTMQSLGIGGGFIMNVFIKADNQAYTIDAREVAPLAATEDMFVAKSSTHGPLTIAVPGEVMGYHEAHHRFGSMSWKEIIDPSIKICEEGVILTEHMYDSLDEPATDLKNDTHLRKMFVDNTTGDFYKPGKLVFPPKELCQTYRLMAQNGPADFYNGTLAKLVAEDLEEMGSIVTLDDLLAYRADVVSSISVPLNEDILHVVPPSGSGPILAFILNILRGYNLTAASITNATETALTYHRMAEAFKYGFAKRWEFGDTRFNDLSGLIRNVTSPEFGEEIRKQIADTKTFNDPKHYGAKFSFQNDNGTSHISVIGPNGDAVSVTSSINMFFGTGRTGRKTGIIFNCGMDDFSTPGKSNYFNIPPSEQNFIRPQKRSISSMSPIIVTDRSGNLKLVVGAAGGTKIISSLASVVAGVLWMGQDIKQALDAPRFHHQLLPNVFDYEYGILEEIVKSLESKGHSVKRYSERGSCLCGLTKNATAIYANADYRKKGGVAGF